VLGVGDDEVDVLISMSVRCWRGSLLLILGKV